MTEPHAAVVPRPRHELLVVELFPVLLLKNLLEGVVDLFSVPDFVDEGVHIVFCRIQLHLALQVAKFTVVLPQHGRVDDYGFIEATLLSLLVRQILEILELSEGNLRL